ncbi:CHAT domain-containing protein [filamentous cyanobacterium LEGE 11480]|uniref:CHAT domain-containing protein n=1 Tax=Romeriopsis navalis LEGE 11480 TaxID=2777977 RepID=A0A928Z455_9CYAN|nr:CHAT domain-containing protein [Romeriopsis navalis]MBE9029930.1 CHAT domain-containing protein [Romeriopsis navalis LEGE 11480]
MAQLQRVLSIALGIGIITSSLAPMATPWVVAQTTSDRIQGLLDRGAELASQKQYERALQQYQQALKQFSQNQPAKLKGQILSRIGNIYRDRRQYDQAIPYFKQARVIYQAGQHHLLEGITLRAIGLSYRNLRQYDQALASLQAAKPVLFKQPDRYWQMLIWYDLGNLYARRRDYPKAIQAFQTALPLARALKRGSSTGQTLYKLAQAQHQLKQFTAAETNYKASLPLLRAANYRRSEANVQLQLGRLANDQRQPRRAIPYFQTVLRFARKIPTTDLEYAARLNLGRSEQQLGNLRQATTHLTTALKLAQQGDHQSQIWIVLEALGNVALQRGDYARAITQLSQARKIAIAIQNPQGEHSTTLNLGNAYYAVGDYNRAGKTYQQALTFAQQRKDLAAVGQIVGSLGILYRQTRDYPQALEFTQLSLEIAEKLNDVAEKQVSLMDLGLLYSATQKPKLALNAYQKALALAKRTDNPRAIGKIYGNIGALYTQQQDYTQGAKFMRLSVALAQQSQDLREQGVGLSNLGAILNQLGQYAEAETHLRQSIAIWDKQRQGLNRNLEYKTADRQKIALFERQTYTYSHLQRSLVAQAKAEAALEISEQSRTRALVELMARKRQGQTVRLKEQLDINIDRLKQIAQAQKATIVEYALLRDNVKPEQRAQSKYGQADLLIWVIQPSGQVTLRQVDLRPLVKAQNIELDNLIRMSRNTIGVRSRGITIAAAQPSTDALPTIDQPLRQLHQFLIEPIQDLLPSDPTQHVVFIPQKQLFTVPFYALQDAQGRYLLEQHTIRTAPSIQALGQTQPPLTNPSPQRHQALFQNALIVGNPTMPSITLRNGAASEQLLPLPNATTEAQAIARIAQTKALIGPQATKSLVLERMQQAKLVHLATHGLLDDFQDLGIPGAIALAPDGTGQPNDGILTTDELTDPQRQLPAELVVLSACNTGRGTITGDGVIGLSRAFLGAGVPSVVVSLWAVDDRSTSVLMTEFYRNLKTNPDRAAALRQAMLKTRQQYPDPFHWAAFTLVGQK